MQAGTLGADGTGALADEVAEVLWPKSLSRPSGSVIIGLGESLIGLRSR